LTGNYQYQCALMLSLWFFHYFSAYYSGYIRRAKPLNWIR